MGKLKRVLHGSVQPLGDHEQVFSVVGRNLQAQPDDHRKADGDLQQVLPPSRFLPHISSISVILSSRAGPGSVSASFARSCRRTTFSTELTMLITGRRRRSSCLR